MAINPLLAGGGAFAAGPMALGAALQGAGSFFGNKKDSGRDAGNALNLSSEDAALANKQFGNLLNFDYDKSYTDPSTGSTRAAEQVQNNPLLSAIFGKDGTMSRTNAEEQNLASRGFSLKPEDYEAYGQASDQMAREFGANESNLAQALSNRGLSSSGSAGNAFAGLQGNKMEQLGQMQRKIANDRMQSNLARLGQTRSFLTNLSLQAGHELGNQYDRNLKGIGTDFGILKDKNNAAQSRLSAMQEAAQGNLEQRAQTERTPDWASALSSVGNAGSQAAMGAGFGALSGGQNTGMNRYNQEEGKDALGNAPLKQLPATRYGGNGGMGV